MKRIRQTFRLLYINYVFAKHGLDEIVLNLPFFTSFRFLIYFNPWNWVADKNRSRGERIRLALEELGPIFVKFGQMLSTRGDLLAEEIILELAKLRDQVPPFPGKEAQTIIERTYRKPIKQIFLEFDATPLASASIAQVHAVTLLDGNQAVAKIVRPGIEKRIRQDVDLLSSLATIIERFWARGKQLELVELVCEFERIIFGELDLLREAGNAAQLKRNFSHENTLYVPEIHWPLTTEKILVMERIQGIPIHHIDSLLANQVDLKKLAEYGVSIFFKQVFQDCFFHGDMHPGNVFIDASDPKNPCYIVVDFGIMGSVSSKDQRYLAENFLAFFQKDYRRGAELHLESGWVPPDTHLDEFESALRTICEPMNERPLRDISVGQMLMRLLQTGRKFHMKPQPQLILLQKTLISVEGMGRQLYPDLDLWATAQPILEKWVHEKNGLSAIAKKTMANLPYWLEKLPTFPILLCDALENINRFPVALETQTYPLSSTKKQLDKKLQKRGFFQGICLASLGIGLFSLISLLLFKTMLTLAISELLTWQAIGFLCVGIVALLMTLF